MVYSVFGLDVDHSNIYACSKNLDFCLPIHNFYLKDADVITPNCFQAVPINCKTKRTCNSAL